MAITGVAIDEQDDQGASGQRERLSLPRTRLGTPALRSDLIPRPHLLAQLRKSPEPRLTLLSAPAGFGKTTLLAEWLTNRSASEAARPRVAWLQIDRQDDDPAHFWRYMVAALQSVCPQVDGRSLETGDGDAPPDRWLPGLIEWLAETEPFLLVLDDYHFIRAPAIHHGVHYLLQHLPPSARVAIAGRADPSLPLARFRAQGELLELRAADLRFSFQEIAQFLNEHLQLQLCEADIALLERRTEGWPAAARLVAQLLEVHPPQLRGRFLQTFTGSHHYILNYLLEEVVQQQEPDVRDFLLRTSVFHDLSPSLCAAATGQPVRLAGRTLERLSREQLFIHPLDDRGQWYRYHPLFAEAMRSRLEQVDPDLWNRLHDKAGQWQTHNGRGADPLTRGNFGAEQIRDNAGPHDSWPDHNTHPLLHDLEEAPLLEKLTPREQEILCLIAQGASNQEIADRLFLSVGTVKGHVNHIFGKLGVHKRTAAVAHAHALQLIQL